MSANTEDLRDAMAMLVLSNMNINDNPDSLFFEEDVSRQTKAAYIYADIMLKTREERRTS